MADNNVQPIWTNMSNMEILRIASNKNINLANLFGIQTQKCSFITWEIAHVMLPIQTYIYWRLIMLLPFKGHSLLVRSLNLIQG